MEPIPPDLFYIDYNVLLEALVTVVVFSFIIERVLAVLFESRPFIVWAEASEEVAEVKDENGNIVVKGKKAKGKKSGIRELIAIVVSLIFIFWIQFDFMGTILRSEEATKPGLVLTAFLITGGSKASMGLFKDLMGFMSSAEKERKKNQ